MFIDDLCRMKYVLFAYIVSLDTSQLLICTEEYSVQNLTYSAVPVNT